MKRISAVVFDLEIRRAVPDRDKPREPGVEYCAGWHDHAGMGVSVLAAIDLLTGQTRVYLEDNLAEFGDLAAKRECVIGFNSIQFDDKVMAAAGVPVTTTYDLKAEVFSAASGKVGKLSGENRRGGRTLDELARVNLGVQKAMSGAFAPVLWQQGKRGQVIDYCIRDTWLTAKLALTVPTLIDPVSGRELTLRPLLEPAVQQDLSLLAPAA